MKKVIAMVLAGVITVSFIQPVYAASKTVTLGSIVQISMADLKVLDGLNTFTHVTREYQEDRESVTNSSTDIDSGGREIIENLFPDLSDPDMDWSDRLPDKENQTLTEEEFLDLIGKHDQEIQDKYEQALEDAKENVQKGNKEDAEKIKDMIETIMNGRNPFTGEEFNQSPDYDFGGNYYKDLNDIPKSVWDIINQYLNPSDFHEGMVESQKKEVLSKFMASYIDYLKKEQYELLFGLRMDKEEYINDELIYQYSDADFGDISYRCNTCGKIYGFHAICECGKYLDGTVPRDIHNSGEIDADINELQGFTEDGKSTTRFQYAVQCGCCGKELHKTGIEFDAADSEKFYYGSNGHWKCYDCVEKYNNGDPNSEYNAADEYSPYFDDYIIPKKSFFSMVDEVENADELMDLFIESYNGEMADELKMLYKEGFFMGNTDVDAMMESDVYKSIIEKLNIGYNDALTQDSYHMVPGSELEPEEFAKDKLVYEFSDVDYQGDYHDIRYQCSICKQIYGFQKICECGKFLDGSLQEEVLNNGIFNGVIEEIFSFSNFFSDGTSNTNFQSPIQCQICGKEFTKASVMPGASRREKFYYGSNGKWKCYECVEKEGGDPNAEYDKTDESSVYFKDFISPKKTTISQIKNDMSKAEILKLFCQASPEQEAGVSQILDMLITVEQIFQMGMSNGANGNIDKLEQFFIKYEPGLRGTQSGQNLSPNLRPSQMEKWTKEDLQNLLDAMEEAYENGIPGYTEIETEKIKDTSQYEESINKIFGEWPSDPSKWTDKQKELYEQFKQEFENNITYEEMEESGVFDGKNPQEIIDSINEYIAGFTTIEEKVTVTTTVEATGSEEKRVSKKYKVYDAMSAKVYNSSGQQVRSFVAVDELTPVSWLADTLGRFFVVRAVDIYTIKWDIVTQNVHATAEAVLPNGETELLLDREIIRIVEDKSGMKAANMETVKVDPIYIQVVEGSLDVDKLDFFDTERIS